MSIAGRAQAWVQQHRAGLLAGGVGLTALVALYLRHRARTTTGDPSVTVPAGYTPAPTGTTGYATTGGGGGYYDSTATDVYNAIEPQLMGLARQLEELRLQPGPVASPPAPAPVGAPVPAPAPAAPAPAAIPVALLQQLPPGSGDSWDAWQAGQSAAGRVAATPGQMDWGVIARGTLPSTATRSDVYFRSLALQQRYPDIHRQYPMYVPSGVASGIRW